MTDQFQLLPEWAEQAAVLMAWPHHETDWSPWLDAIEQDYVQLAVAIAREVTPIILCQDKEHKAHINSLLADQCRKPPELLIQPYNDTWCRDYGPITLSDSNTFRLMDFCFNGWGDKYEASLDNGINSQLQPLWTIPLQAVDFELEGGSIETDGQGTLLTTEHCLLDSNRNTHMDRAEIESFALNTLGLQRVLWLSKGALVGDDTDSHIDNLARFTDAGTIVYAQCSDENDPHYPHLTAMETELRSFTQTDGQPYKLEPVAIPSPQLSDSGQRLPGSYINFLILNGSVIMPIFGCKEDDLARATLQRCFPDKEIVTVPGNNLIKQFGGPHCATMQIPKGIYHDQ